MNRKFDQRTGMHKKYRQILLSLFKLSVTTRLVNWKTPKIMHRKKKKRKNQIMYKRHLEYAQQF